MGIDKIPIEIFREDPVTETYHCGSLELTKAEYANAEKINQVIDEMIHLGNRLTKVENK